MVRPRSGEGHLPATSRARKLLLVKEEGRGGPRGHRFQCRGDQSRRPDHASLPRAPVRKSRWDQAAPAPWGGWGGKKSRINEKKTHPHSHFCSYLSKDAPTRLVPLSPDAFVAQCKPLPCKEASSKEQPVLGRKPPFALSLHFSESLLPVKFL